VTDRLERTADLQRAVDEGEFVLHYQPIVSLDGGESIALEALIRWVHPERGLLLPKEFIALAEETGLIIPIGRWVLGEACKKVRAWQQDHGLADRLRVSVNISARHFQHEGLLEDVSKALRASHLDPSCLVLEITESVLVHDAESVISRMHDLKNLRGAGASLHRVRANDPGHLEEVLRSLPAEISKVFCIDGVNSMTGNAPDLPQYARICREYDALLYVDDAHGFGIIGESPTPDDPYGRRGNSIVKFFGESYDNIVLVAGFSKAYSSLAAFLALPTSLKNYLKVAAPPYLYSGPSPTGSLATVLAGFKVNEAEGDQIRRSLADKTRRVLDQISRLGFRTLNTSGYPVIEIPLSRADDIDAVGRFLFERGIYVTLAAYPLVPKSQVGFRVQVTAANEDSEIEQLNQVLTELSERFDLQHASQPA
jgi:8-amino-7-oxononanoate synthase